MAPETISSPRASSAAPANRMNKTSLTSSPSASILKAGYESMELLGQYGVNEFLREGDDDERDADANLERPHRHPHLGGLGVGRPISFGAGRQEDQEQGDAEEIRSLEHRHGSREDEGEGPQGRQLLRRPGAALPAYEPHADQTLGERDGGTAPNVLKRQVRGQIAVRDREGKECRGGSPAASAPTGRRSVGTKAARSRAT